MRVDKIQEKTFAFYGQKEYNKKAELNMPP